MSVVDVLARSPGRADDVALASPDGVWTYAQLGEAVDVRVGELRAEGPGRSTSGVAPTVVVRPGAAPTALAPTVVAPEVASIVELLALWRAGAVPAPLNARLTEAERDRARAGLSTGGVPESTQVVLWTSGTSGRPRGIALSWDNLEAITHASEQRLGLTGDDVWVASLSPAHVGGLVLIVRALLLGGALAVPAALDAETLSDLMDAGLPSRGGRSGASRGSLERPPVPLVPTHVSLVPTQLHRILDIRGQRGAPAALRCALIGGAHAPASLVAAALDAGWPLALTYGATEMSSQIATAPPDLVRAKPGTVGAPMPGVEVAVSGAGELLARGRTLALGCVGEDVPPLVDRDGWYHTGDLGRIDEDGHAWITGRRIDRIVSGGVTIDAVEVEEALRAHPRVADACVVGLPDPEWGERVGAWVEPVAGDAGPGDPTGSEPTAEVLAGHLRDRVTGAKMPRVWHVSPGLPRNANGKADRAAVRAALSGSRSTRPA